MIVYIDFDGVVTNNLTEDNFLEKYEIAYLKSDISIELSKPNPIIEKILSFLILFSDIYIITERPNSQKSLILNWLYKYQLEKYISKVISCKYNPKANYINNKKTILLIKDKKYNLIKLNNKVVIYKGQKLSDLILILSEKLIYSNVRLRKIPSLKLYEVKNIGSLGSSIAFLITYSNNIKHKLRICKNIETFNNINSVLDFSNKNKIKFIPRKITSIGYCVLKEYIDGIKISEVLKDKRKKIIQDIAICLKEFHLKCMLDKKHIILCCIDNFNIIINDNNIFFIDLEASRNGNYLIDLIWAEKLLCFNYFEKTLFLDSYFKNEKIKLTIKELNNEYNNYKSWLHHQLLDSYLEHKDDLEKKSTIFNILKSLWEEKELPLLIKYCNLILVTSLTKSK